MSRRSEHEGNQIGRCSGWAVLLVCTVATGLSVAGVGQARPAAAAPPATFGTTIAAGYDRSLVLRSDGTVWAFGYNRYGELGTTTNNGTSNPNPTPTQVPGLTNVTAIAAGNYHSLVLRSDGTVWAFGNNPFGELGTTTNNGTSNPNPTPVPGLTNVTAIAAGYYHSLVLRSDGTVWAFGNNEVGQLGTTTNNGTSNPNPTPTQVPGLTNVTAIAASYYNSLVLRSDGTVWAFGNNEVGQLGTTTNNGTRNPNPTPTQVPGLTNVTAIAAGYDHSLVLRSDGTVWAFGYNRYGELGTTTNNGTSNPNPTPTQVPGLTNVTAIAAGYYHSLVLRSDGTVSAFGYNYYGELGTTTNNDNTNPNPTPVPGLTNVTAIAAGSYHTLALRFDGTVAAFGYNYFGQLGTTTNNGTISPNPAPTQVPGLSGVAQPGGTITGGVLCPVGTLAAGQPKRAGDTNCDGLIRVAVLGDSYTAGEGGYDAAHPYRPFSNMPFDRCHRDVNSWALREAASLGIDTSTKVVDYWSPSGIPTGDSVLFAACSGAVASNVATAGQNGESSQIAQLAQFDPATVDVVLMTLGGNDAAFEPLIRQCLKNDCGASNIEFTKKALDVVRSPRDKVASALTTVRTTASHAEVYVLGYPDPVNPPGVICGGVQPSVAVGTYGRIDANEQQFVHQTFIPALNTMVHDAADAAGVTYLDGTQAFAGAGICDASPDVHGAILGETIPSQDPNTGLPNGSVELFLEGPSSFHPNVTGYQAMAVTFNNQMALHSWVLGNHPNPAPVAPLVVIPQLNGPIVTSAGGTITITLQGGPPNSAMLLVANSVPTIVGRGTTDNQGNASITMSLPDAAPPGIHHVYLVDQATGQPITSTYIDIPDSPTCTDYAHDTDGDGLADICDPNPTDGPLADYDHDGVANGVDNCQTVANANQADTNSNGVGDACDPTLGVNPTATFPDATRGDPLLRVVTSPAVPSQITVDGTPTDTWGLTWMKTTAGSHTVCFSDVVGYVTPACQTVTATLGATTTVTGSFVRRGTLRVSTSPAVASTISVDGTPRNDWGMWTDLDVGSHQVCFGAVVGFTPPGCLTVNVTAGTTSTLTAFFHADAAAVGPTGYGTLQITTSPAVPAQIIVDGVIRDSWGAWFKITPGAHTVCFTGLQGFTTPACQTVNVTAAATTAVVGTYTARGFLRVITNPAVAATILVNGTPHNDWGMWTDLPTGPYTICFGVVPTKTTPACQQTTLTASATTTITGAYT
jgi:alpha-tubulin suppressor-like RCC1 family protein/lysophospholipase L1-like esterase